jgi:peptidoglycan/xylan/chitin deacetylase (PgdA/CDA1 family)
MNPTTPNLARVGLASGLILLGLAMPSSRTMAEVIQSGPPTCQAIALTFDMCPVRKGSGYDEPLITELIDKQIPATFFLSGRWMAKHEAEVRRLLEVPFFEVGSHGQIHAHLPLMDASRQREEINGPIVTLETKFGRRTDLFRPPYGEYDDATVEAAHALGLRFILWNAVSGDPDPALSREKMRDQLLRTVRSGSIIVFHANGKGRHTREVVGDLYQELVVKRGLKPVTVSDLLDGCNDGITR